MDLPSRLEYALLTLKLVKHILDSSSYPPCCVKVSRGKLECEVLGALSKKLFEKECRKCQEEMRKKLKTLYGTG